MSIITLTSDFGLTDYRVPAIKGKILSENAEAKIVDITHEIQAYNLIQASYIIRNSYKFFPNGSVHIISVDSFFHPSRKNIIYKADGSYFISSDNGLLSLVFHDLKPEAIYEITYFNHYEEVVNFASTDIFAPVALHLANGGLPEIVGKKMKSAKELSYPKPVFNESEKMVIGEVLYIDNYGNIISNISQKFFEESKKGFSNFIIKFRNLTITKVYSRYTEIVSDWSKESHYHGNAAAIFNSSQALELTIYKGSKKNGANTLFGLNVGEKIYIEFS